MEQKGTCAGRSVFLILKLVSKTAYSKQSRLIDSKKEMLNFP